MPKVTTAKGNSYEVPKEIADVIINMGKRLEELMATQATLQGELQRLNDQIIILSRKNEELRQVIASVRRIAVEPEEIPSPSSGAYEKPAPYIKL